MINIIYSPNYLLYSFGSGHPFWPQRANVFLENLKKTDFNYKIVSPAKAKDEDILLVHGGGYLDRVKKLAEENGFLSIDTPVNENVLEAAYWSVGGSILAAQMALKGKKAVNLLGGLHHAGIDDSSGFCIFNDQAIAIRWLQKRKLIKKALVYDLDVHAGQGTQEIFYNDPKVFTISLHQDPTTLYPGTGFPEQIGQGKGKGFNKNIIFSPGTKEAEYLVALDSVLGIYKEYKPDLVCLVLGTDTYKGDPLAGLCLEEETYYKIGQRFTRFPKLAIFFAGGYARKTPELWLNFIEGLVE